MLFDRSDTIPLQLIFETAPFAHIRLCLCLAATLLLSACGAGETGGNDSDEAEPVTTVFTCEIGNALVGQLGGSDFAMGFRWGHETMDCENMLRPDRDGPRLRFSGPYVGPDGEASDTRIAFILALPGLDASESGIEVPTNITVQIEGSGRFFSTANMQSCWTEVKANAPVEESPGLYRVGGAVFCVAPLGELNSNDFIEITELAFTTVVDWSNS